MAAVDTDPKEINKLALVGLSRPSAEEEKENRKLADRLWKAITIHSLVLAPEFDEVELPEGWWEAIVLTQMGDEFILYWRDYPEQGLFRRRRDQLALLPVKA